MSTVPKGNGPMGSEPPAGFSVPIVTYLKLTFFKSFKI